MGPTKREVAGKSSTQKNIGAWGYASSQIFASWWFFPTYLKHMRKMDHENPRFRGKNNCESTTPSFGLTTSVLG